MAVKIPALQQGRSIVDDQGRPTAEFIRSINDNFKVLEDAQNATAEALAAAGIATAAAAAATAAAGNVNSEASLINSFIPDGSFTPPLISADSLGNVTIANHSRQYGDMTLNPTVAVTGGVVASGATPGQNVRIYYVDPSRAGGAVTYLFTVDPAPAPVQGMDVHSVGAVTIPAAGTQDGNFVRPPGYVEP